MSAPDPDAIANWRAIRARIAAACEACGRAPESVALVAVTKGQTAARIRPLLEAGHRLFAENRVQEARAKWPALREEFPDLVLQLIGPLQTNKSADAVALFDTIATLDRERLAVALAAAIGRSDRRPDCLVEINTGREAQKAGIDPDAADAFIADCRERHGLPIVGLMTIPPADQDPESHFALLARIAARNGLARLSMGMSGDFEAAIRAGATEVRIGTALFGPRR